jgi:putative colanic acid biosynthesis acetyltransferase WcaF
MRRDQMFRPSPHSIRNRIGRYVWSVVWLVVFRPSPTLACAWRRFVLRMFGAKVGQGVTVYSSARIWAPWNLTMKDRSCLSHHVDCYCVAPISIGFEATISQYTFLCSASHDVDGPDMALTIAPIVVGDHVWIAADVFLGPGVNVGEGAVVGARSTVLQSVPAWTVVGGYPARKIRTRDAKKVLGTRGGCGG